MVRVNNVEISDETWDVLIDLQAKLTKKHKKKVALAKIIGAIADKEITNFSADDFLDDLTLPNKKKE